MYSFQLKKLKILIYSTLITGMLLAFSANASLLGFDVFWSGAAYNNTASAKARITIDDTLFNNPGYTSGTAWVTSFSITVSGASAGNGTFGLSNYNNFTFDSGAFSPLDLTRELVGQPTQSCLWGVGICFGFDIFTNASSVAPTAPLNNRIVAAGSNEWMWFTSFTPVASVPEPSAIALLTLGLLGLGFARKRKSYVRH